MPQVLKCISAELYVALVFIATNTLVSLQPSTVTPIHLNYNNSLPLCPQFFSLHNQHHNVTECANANITFDHVIFHTDCTYIKRNNKHVKMMIKMFEIMRQSYILGVKVIENKLLEFFL